MADWSFSSLRRQIHSRKRSATRKREEDKCVQQLSHRAEYRTQHHKILSMHDAPPHNTNLLPPMASISSMKMMLGLCALAA
jgi:hypothetical protein